MFIFFDIDETLIDQRKAEAAAAERLLATHGQRLGHLYTVPEFCRKWRLLREKHAPAFFAGAMSAEEQRRRRVREMFGDCCRNLSQQEADSLFDFYERHYRADWSLFDDVLPALRSLFGFGFGIISNGRSARQKLKLRQTGIEHYFDVIVVAEDAGAAKPQQEIFLAACHQARSPADRCVYVGDRLDHDALPSQAIGMRSFWLDRRNTREPAPVEVIGSLLELAPKLKSGMRA